MNVGIISCGFDFSGNFPNLKDSMLHGLPENPYDIIHKVISHGIKKQAPYLHYIKD